MVRTYFGAGPTLLPDTVLQNLSKALFNYKNTGLSIVELSQRSDEYAELLNDTQRKFRTLAGISEQDYTLLFIQGGARMEFQRIAQNFLTPKQTAGYIQTGYWAKIASELATPFGNIHQYEGFDNSAFYNEQLRYLHLTTNNTIQGTQWHEIPHSKVPLVADMSSDIFGISRDFNQFDLFYACAQKNLGIAGLSILAIKTTFLETASNNIPTMMSYRIHAQANSIYNTPPIFAVLACNEMLRWIEQQGGIAVLEQRNREKSHKLYHFLEQSKIFTPKVFGKHRSIMNVCFSIDPTAKTAFEIFCKEQQIKGIQGHRKAGDYRVSLYNAIPIDQVDYLLKCMADFENKF